MKLGSFFFLAVTVSLAACTQSTTDRLQLPPLQTAERVELSRYTGTWYEIASFPQRFQKGCTATTATYSIRDDGDISVLNRCKKGEKEVSAEGLARVVDTKTNAKLEVSFFRPFWGAYWILEVGNEYQYAVVGNPTRDYLWILSRTPSMDKNVYQDIIKRLEMQGYEVERLVKTEQPSITAQSI